MTPPAPAGSAEFLDALGALRQATVGGRRAPHKPLLLLWMLARYAGSGTATAAYAEAEAPVSALIDEYGPPSRSLAGRRAAMPFVHLERSLWELTDRSGAPLDARREYADSAALHRLGAVGRLRPEVTALLTDPSTFAAAVFLLLERHFTGALEIPLCDRLGLDLSTITDSALEASARTLLPAMVAFRSVRRRVRNSAFADAVLSAYGQACAMCGFDGRLDHGTVGVEAAHVRWHSQGGPDRVDNALALCALHHALFDHGVLGLSADRTVLVSPRYTAATPSGLAVRRLVGRPVARPRGTGTLVAREFLHWHDHEVFKH